MFLYALLAILRLYFFIEHLNHLNIASLIVR